MYSITTPAFKITAKHVHYMDKGLTLPKRVLIAWLEILQIPQNLSAQFVCPSPKVLDFNEKRLHWGSIVRGREQVIV